MRVDRNLGLIAAASTLIALAGCSSSSSGGTSPSSGGSSASSSSASSGSQAQAAAQAALVGPSKPAPFVAPGPAFKASQNLRGKTVYFIADGLSYPFVQQQFVAFKQAASLLGIKAVGEDTGGSTVTASRQIAQAIGTGAAAITVEGVQTAGLGEAIKQAAAHHIPVIATGDAETPQRASFQPAGVFGNATASYTQAGELMADIAVAKVGIVHAVFIQSADQNHSVEEYSGFKSRLTALCSTCSVSSTNVNLADWATGVGPATTTAVADPSVNVLAILYDAELPYALPALKSANADNRVSVVTYNGTLPGLQDVAKGAPVIGDPGASDTWLGWQTMDQMLRALSGQPPATQLIPNRAFTTANVKSLQLTSSAAGGSEWFTNVNMKTEFSKLWGLG